jgi:hypothetical protein
VGGNDPGLNCFFCLGPVSLRESVVAEALMSGVKNITAFANLVKRLQEALSRLEDFEVVTVNQTGNLALSVIVTTIPYDISNRS